jgi:hypothetical protein
LILAVEHQPVVQARGTALPEFDMVWSQSEATPVFRAGGMFT